MAGWHGRSRNRTGSAARPLPGKSVLSLRISIAKPFGGDSRQTIDGWFSGDALGHGSKRDLGDIAMPKEEQEG